MPDMLVKLYELGDVSGALHALSQQGVTIRRALPPERHLVVEWVREHFSDAWASECAVSMSDVPTRCFIAAQKGEILGFACYEAACKNFFGPTGVRADVRGRGIGRALLLASLDAMRAMGYAYAIIGGAGPVDFYRKHAGATVIEGSSPGIYAGMLRSRRDKGGG